MPDNLNDLKAEYPEYRLTIERMANDGRSFEEIESHLIYLLEIDDD